MRQLARQLRTEGAGPGREAAAIGTGVFIGCTPFFGFHLTLCLIVGRLLRLNRLKMYLAANISNPFMAPFLVLGELQVGGWLRRGEWHALTLDTAKTIDPWTFGSDILVGSVVVGGVLGLSAALATWFAGRGDEEAGLGPLIRRAADRYVGTSVTAWEFARGKLRGDPLYRTVLTGGVLRSGQTLVDVGCGQGLMLALLAEAQQAWGAGTWPGSLPAPPRFERLSGIETRPRVAAIARRALGADAVIIEGDAREHVPSACSAVLFFDVLHMMPLVDQERLLASIAGALDLDGVILVREADAAAGWRFKAISAGNRAKAILFGNWRQTFHFRTAVEWQALFERLGFKVARFETGQRTPFANVLFVLTLGARRSGRLGTNDPGTDDPGPRDPGTPRH
jgi:uncharacterized protein (DUF2062 family)